MSENFCDKVWELLGNGALTHDNLMESIIYAGFSLHLEAMEQLAANIEMLRVELMKIEQKLGTEDLNQENKESNTL